LGFANLASLNGFRNQRLREVDLKGVEWVQLAPSVQALNPQFNHLHSLRVGDIGWGFDREGCISIAIFKEADGFIYKSSPRNTALYGVEWKLQTSENPLTKHVSDPRPGSLA
jgi:hypothetical protein